MKEWEKYEQKLFEKFQSEFPNATLIKNHKITGKYSQVSRQIDIAVKQGVIGYEVIGVIECKYFSRKIDVKIIEGFITFLEDVGANFGIIITNNGYSSAAKNWAQAKNIRLDIVDMSELEEYHFVWEECHICDPGEDKPPALISFEFGYAIENDNILSLFDVGRCQWCNAIHIRCHSCGVITGIAEYQYGEVVECEGGCGLKIVVEQKYVGNGMFEEEIYPVEE